MNKKIALSLIPVIFLIVMLGMVIHIYGPDALNGGSEVVLILSTGVCSLIAITAFKVKWKTIEDEINSSIGSVGSAVVILLLIGMLSGAWMVSGVVPTLIYYGMQIINPHVFLISACAISCVVSLMTGSSWTTVATIGVALMGIGKAEGLSDGWVAGAILSGSYFGDKMSPLSDTTVLASSLVGTPLFTHIRYMTITTTPAITLALLIYLVAGFAASGAQPSDITAYTTALSSKYNMSLWLMLVPVLTGWMIYRKLPAMIVLFSSTVIAAVMAVIFQPHILMEIQGASDASALTMFKGVLLSAYGSTAVDTGSAAVNALVESGGMQGMLFTVWLILCAMCFGGALKASGMLANIMSLMLPLTRTRVGLVATTVVTGIFFNTTVSDQYLSIMLSSSMYKDIYSRKGYEPRLLSRTVEDSCTVTSVLVPWSSCGMTQATVLSVPTVTYMPYCFFNMLCPLVSIAVAAIGYKIGPTPIERGDGPSPSPSPI